jgi:ERCC4-related helicase
MAALATDLKDLDLIAPGSRVVVRDLDWHVIEVERHVMGAKAIVRCIGRSELVRGQPAAFHSDLDRIEPEDPTRTRFRLDDSPGGIETRLIVESLIRRTPLPVSNTNLTVGQSMLVDDLPYQREPFRVAMEQLQPRLLVADSVGLGKTIEVGILLAELQRRGRADRVLAVVPRHILDQVQHELWCRAGFPLVRLDSDGIQRLRQRIPAGRNPFAYFNRVIVSIDTIKNPSRYRHHLERVRWDVVWIDESHKLVNRGTLNNQLAKVIAPNADALILTSATPHNGKAESFAELISLLDPTAVADPETVTADDIAHLVVRRHKHSPDVEAVIGDRWAERADPLPVLVAPTADEEAVFAELSATWIGAGVTPPCDDRLFPWTLLKAALSSPVALSETIGRRLARRRVSALTDATLHEITPEAEALRRLYVLADEAAENGSAKLAELINVLKTIGVGKNSDVRAVVFSERIATLDWIAAAIREALGLRDYEVETFHNSKSDEQQQAIIEDFSMAHAPIRVLVTSDIASEGVNLHKQCHHLVHFDLPWSLITLEQRNGRIDRYGQAHSPEIRYLVYSPHDPEIASDVRIVKKLIEKEHAAHKALGDAATVMGVYSESAEEDKIIEALRQRTDEEREAKLEEVAAVPQTFDPWAFVGLASPCSATGPALPLQVPIDAPPSLFDGDAVYLEAALRHAFDYKLDQLGWETDGQVLSFRPPDDLLARLGSLPQSYLRQRSLADRLRLTADKHTASKSLADAVNERADAGETGTAWPEVHHLGPQHPVLEWIADKILYRVARNEAVAIACGVREPTVLVSGVWSNRLGEPIAAAWLGATIEDGIPVFEDLQSVLGRGRLITGLVNRQWAGDIAAVEAMLGHVVQATTTRLSDSLEAPLQEINRRLAVHRARLETWQREAILLADGIKSDPHRRRRLTDIDRVTRQIDALIAERTPADGPLVRIVGALLPGSS